MMPDVVRFDNGTELRRNDVAKPVDYGGGDAPWFHVQAMRYEAMRAFAGGTRYAEDFERVDDAAAMSCGELYLENFEGYVDETGTYTAKTVAVSDDGRYTTCVIDVWDVGTDEHAWYMS